MTKGRNAGRPVPVAIEAVNHWPVVPANVVLVGWDD